MKAQVALPFVIIVSTIIVEAALVGALIAYFLSTSGLNERLAARAENAALSGVYDAFLRVTRDKEFASLPVNYSFFVSNDAVVVSVTRDSGSGGEYIYTVEAVGTARTRQKKFVGTLIVNNITGETHLQSIVDTPI